MTPNLHTYLSDVHMRPFQWGAHDCVVFTNQCWWALYGFGWADDWLGRYHDEGKPFGPKRLRDTFGHDNFGEAIDARLRRVSGVAPRGALVAANLPYDRILRLTLGISLGDRAVYLAHHGIYFDDIGNAVAGWVN